MEYEVLVPLPVEVVRRLLREPAVLARCLPGLALDGPASPGKPVGGRLRMRLAGTTITYRGAFTATPGAADADAVTVTAEGHEARGDAEMSATVLVTAQDSGPDAARLLFSGDLTVKGRLAELEPPTVAAAGRRLAERFAQALVADPAAAHSAEAETAPSTAPETGTDDAVDLTPRVPVDDGLSDYPEADDVDLPGAAEEPVPGEPVDVDLEAGESPGALEPARMRAGGLPDDSSGDPSDLLDGPVRRSIVGRSAEEVDHAPPRGRYAPALPARSAWARAAARWSGGGGPAAPVALSDLTRAPLPWVIGGAAALLGGAVALARVLRRR